MKIYTRRGDKGKTSLLGPERVEKCHPRVRAYGELDELNSFLGLLLTRISAAEKIEDLKQIQRQLFLLGSELASEQPGKLKDRVAQSDTAWLEDRIDAMESDLPTLKNFILPGGGEAASLCHIVRSVSRRAERATVSLSETHPISLVVLEYLNRLSDYFFVLARWLNKNEGHEDVILD